jgi:hypothetical protein
MREQHSMTDVIAKGADAVVEWIGSFPLPLQVSDQLLVEQLKSLSEQKAHKLAAKSRQESVKWASIALRLMEMQAEQGPKSHNRSCIEAMMLMAAMIVYHGRSDETPVLSVEALCRYFTTYVKHTIDQVEEMAKNWRTLPVAEIGYLRGIKNRLSALQWAKPKLGDAMNQMIPSIDQWMSLKDKLP